MERDAGKYKKKHRTSPLVLDLILSSRFSNGIMVPKRLHKNMRDDSQWFNIFCLSHTHSLLSDAAASSNKSSVLVFALIARIRIGVNWDWWGATMVWALMMLTYASRTEIRNLRICVCVSLWDVSQRDKDAALWNLILWIAAVRRADGTLTNSHSIRMEPRHILIATVLLVIEYYTTKYQWTTPTYPSFRHRTWLASYWV